jgi:anti-anti-sigma regulatory factor
MPEPLAWTVRDDEGPAVVAVHGVLRVAGTSPLRRVLLKCLASQPDALLVDLSRVRAAEPTALGVFDAVARQAARWPGTPVVLCGPAPPVEARLRRRGERLSIHASVADALRAVREGNEVSPSLTDQLLPAPGAVRHARDMVTDACARWGLPDLVGPAGLVADELVANGVEHAGTLLTLRISHRDRYLHVAVGDGSAEPPRLPPPAPPTAPQGLGLMLVDAIATHWGWLPSNEGKVVWATLSVGSR